MATGDSLASTAAAAGTIADTVVTGDALAATSTAAAAVADTVATSENYTSQTSASYDLFLTDTVATGDSLAATAAATGTITETAATGDTLAATSAATAAVADTVATSDQIEASADNALTLADTVATSETLTTAGGLSPSPDGTVITAGNGGQIVDASLNIWTIVDGEALMNDTAPAYSTSVVVLAYVSGIVYQENIVNQWYEWIGYWNAVYIPPLMPTYALSLADTAATSETYTAIPAGTYILFLSDTIVTSDSLANTTTIAPIQVTETVATADELASSGVQLALADTIATADELASSGVHLALADTVATADNIQAPGSFTLQITETAATGDALAVTSAAAAAVVDTVATSDQPAASVDTALTLADTVATSDAMTIAGGLTPSPNDTMITVGNGGQIVDASLNVWTIVDGEALMNGTAPDYSSGVAALAYIGGVVYQENIFNQWYEWIGYWNAVYTPPLAPTYALSLDDTVATQTTFVLQGGGVYNLSLSDFLATTEDYSSAVAVALEIADYVTTADAIDAIAMMPAEWADVVSPTDSIIPMLTLYGLVGARTRQPRAGAAVGQVPTTLAAIAGRTRAPQGAGRVLFCAMSHVQSVAVAPDIRTVQIQQDVADTQTAAPDIRTVQIPKDT